MSETFKHKGIETHYGGLNNEQIEKVCEYHEGVIAENLAILEFLRNILAERMNKDE